MQINGQINMVGAGLAGGVADSVYSHAAAPIASNLGIAGYGTTMAQGGLTKAIYSNQGERWFFQANDNSRIKSYRFDSHTPRIVAAEKNSFDKPHLTLSPTGELLGMPVSLMGTSGSSGGPVIDPIAETVMAKGGNGAPSGGALALFADGFSFGEVGKIDLSGGVGEQGELLTVFGRGLVRGGAGAGGMPGGLMFVVMDSGQTLPNLTETNCILNQGESDETVSVVEYVAIYATLGSSGTTPVGTFHFHDNNWNNESRLPNSSPEKGGGTLKVAENLWLQNRHIISLDTKGTPEEDGADYVETIPTFTLTEKLNTPVTPNGDRSTIEVSVTPPSVNNYSYSVVEMRPAGSLVYLPAPFASNESLIVVPSDGTIYDIRIKPVSKKGLIAGPSAAQQITVTDINARTDAVLAGIYPFDAIAGLQLQGENANTFSGRDISFGWGSSNSELTYFNFYQIDLYSSGQLLRTEKSVSPFYVYTYEKNAVDYLRVTGNPGIYANVDIFVKPVSKYFNDSSLLYSGTAATINVFAQALAPDTLTLSYAGISAVISWPETSQRFLTITATLDYNGTILAETTGNSFVIPVEWVGSRFFNIVFSHLAGYTAPPTQVEVNPSKPATPTVTARVISNSVTLNYSSVKGSLPIDRYEIRRGGTYDAGQAPEIKSGSSSFTVSDEIAAGTVVFWFEAVDTAGNRSSSVSVSAIVSQPQNYQLLAQYSAKANSWPGALTNCKVTDSNSLLLPINTTETWAEHFTNNSLNTPQDQIDAGYDYFLQPSTNTAQYQFSYDYASLIDSATITANSAPILLDGSVTVAVHIEFSDNNSDWTSGGAGQTQIIATDFRYIRVTLDFTSVGGDDLAYVEDVLISIDKRVDDDSGKLTAVSTDTNGTRVYFNKDFIDAQTPTVNISSTEIVDVVVDFNDIPDPEYFDVYVFSRSTGLRINASGSWVARGFTRIGT
jgi:hypothetical protein